MTGVLICAGVGVDHSQLVELANEHFVKKRPVWEVEPEVIDPQLGCDLSISQYTGGFLQVSNLLLLFQIFGGEAPQVMLRFLRENASENPRFL